MVPRIFPLLLILAALPCVQAEEKQAKPKQPEQKKEAPKRPEFIRVDRNKNKQPIRLETAIARYQGKNAEGKKVRVDLVGVIHIGDKAYYENLNKRFAKYDAVLYELVTREAGDKPKANQGPSSVIGGMQMGMTEVLDLEFQLDHIDYKRENMVHADMTAKEFSDTMKKREESFLGMYFRMMGKSAAMQAKNPEAFSNTAMIRAMFAEDRSLAMKRVFARQFEHMEGSIGNFGGKKGSTIITERNKKAFQVLTREIAAGKKKIAVFYGAGHLPDMHQRLLDEFKMKHTDSQWLTAWKMEEKK